VSIVSLLPLETYMHVPVHMHTVINMHMYASAVFRCCAGWCSEPVHACVPCCHVAASPIMGSAFSSTMTCDDRLMCCRNAWAPLRNHACRRDVLCLGWSAGAAVYMAALAHLGLLSPGLLIRAAAPPPWAHACLGLVNHGVWRPLITQVGSLG
jgi:hypothetical protein